MPGGRLDYAERQTIAEGLAAGMSYAQIASRLGRPRSTVGREIARNGGPRGYRAARAQNATQWRARRRRPTLAQADPAVAPTDRDPGAVRELQQRFTDALIQAGVPRMMARVLVCLLINAAEGLTVTELTQRLQVSPASISHAIGWLEPLELVRRERTDRRDRYLIDDDLWYRAWSVSTRSIALWAQTARQGVEILGAQTPEGAQLHRATRFFELVSHDMSMAAEHYRHVLTDGGVS